jgi:hypothetical protein
MSVIVTQDIESRYVPGKSAELNYTIRAAFDEPEAGVSLAGFAPTLYQGLWRKERQIEAVHIDTDNPTRNIFKGKVLYGPSDPGDFTTSFDTTGGSQHITQSELTVNAYPAGAPDMQGAIGFDGQRVSGTDIVIPNYAFSETHIKTMAQVNTSYRHTLANLTGCVNNASFRGFADGEVLFRGVSGQLVTIENDKKWQLTFQFAASPNRTGMTIGGITGVAKAGWDYLWVLYGEAVDGGRLVQQPEAAYVERLYPFANFSDLGIGTS